MRLMLKRVSFAATMAALAIFTTSPLWAQDPRLGVKGGIVSSTTYGSAIDDAGSLTRFSAGASVEVGVTRLLLIQPELLYTRKGARAFGQDAGEIRLAYIEIPVLAKLTFGGTRVRPSIFAGPAVAIAASCEVEFVEVADPVECIDPPEEGVDVLDVKSTDFGAVLGAGLEYGLGTTAILVDGRLGLGLTSIADSEGFDFDVKNRVFSLLIGVSFPLGVE